MKCNIGNRGALRLEEVLVRYNNTLTYINLLGV